MAYQFSSQQKANAFVHKNGDTTTYKIAGVNGEQTNAENFRTAMAGLLHVVGKDSDITAGIGRTISQDVLQTQSRTLTITPNTFALSTSAFQSKTVTFNLDYAGGGTIRVTGQKPVGSTFVISRDSIKFTGNSSQTFTAGSTEGITTITIEAAGQYETTQATITWTANSASSFENIA